MAATVLSKSIARLSLLLVAILFSSGNSPSPDLPLMTGPSSVVKFRCKDSALKSSSRCLQKYRSPTLPANFLNFLDDPRHLGPGEWRGHQVPAHQRGLHIVIAVVSEAADDMSCRGGFSLFIHPSCSNPPSPSPNLLATFLLSLVTWSPSHSDTGLTSCCTTWSGVNILSMLEK